MRKLSVIVLVLVLVGGCVTAPADGVSSIEKRELLKLVSPRFEMPKNHGKDVYGILKAVKASQPNRKVDAITFDPIEGVTVYFAAPEKGFSMHGGPFAKVTRDGEAWKIGELWSLL